MGFRVEIFLALAAPFLIQIDSLPVDAFQLVQVRWLVRVFFAGHLVVGRYAAGAYWQTWSHDWEELRRVDEAKGCSCKSNMCSRTLSQGPFPGKRGQRTGSREKESEIHACPHKYNCLWIYTRCRLPVVLLAVSE